MKTNLLLLLAFAITSSSCGTFQKTVPISDRAGVLDNLRRVESDNIEHQQRIPTGNNTFVFPAVIIMGTKPVQPETVL